MRVSGALRRLGCHDRVRGRFFADGAIDPWAIYADIGVVELALWSFADSHCQPTTTSLIWICGGMSV